MYQNDEDITYGMDSTVWRAFEISIENNNVETFKVLNRFVRRVTSMSILNGSLKHFSRYINFPSSYYFISYSRLQENSKYLNLNKFVTEYAALQLKETINHELRYKDNLIDEKKISALQENNKFLYHSFNAFNRLLYFMISNNDSTHFDYVINEYQQINRFEFKNKFQNLKFEVKYSLEGSPDNSKIELYNALKVFEDYKRHVILGLRYWIMYLFSKKQLKEEIAISFINKLQVHADSDEIIKDILFFRGSGWYNYFEWDSWDYIQRYNGKAYSPDSPRDWLTLGFLIDLIKYNRLFFNPKILDEKELSQSVFLYQALQDWVEYLYTNFVFWKEILGIETLEELKSKCKVILETFRNLKKVSVTQKDSLIANEELSQDKIQNFKNLVGSGWKESSLLINLFSTGTIEEVDKKEKLKFIGDRTILEGVKKNFIDGDNYQDILNISQIGREIGRWIDDNFFNIIENTVNPTLIGNKNIFELIEDSISTLREKELVTTIIIIPSNFSYKDEMFISNKIFTPKHELKKSDDNLQKFLVGKYRDIPIYTSYSDYVNNYIIAANFESAFKMRIIVDDEWYENKLEIDVSKIDDIEARRIYDLNPLRWNQKDDINLTADESIVLIKNGVNINVGSYIKFEIKDQNSLVIGAIQNNLEE